ncbi:fibrous sheath-interacting protein 2 [Ctenodactylus gundi]
MDLYLRTCSKAAEVAANKPAASALARDCGQGGDGAHKTHLPGLGPSQLLDLPLGVKLPLIPGSDTVYFTTNISEKLFRPSYGFNLTDPYCRLLETQYKSLHDPHLRAYYKRKDILRRLKKGGYITSNNKIVCTLRELNKYRQYLTNLKLDFERNYLREQRMLAKQLHRVQESNPISECFNIQFQNWLLRDGAHSLKDQEQLIRHRYLDMINKELEQHERTAEQRRLRMDREERQQREHAKRKLNLRRKIEEEWKQKEMLLLTKITEDVKREERIEQQRRKSREESDRKKQALLEKKMAYHLQKMQDTNFKEDAEKNIFENNGQDGTHCESPKKRKKSQDDVKTLYSDGDPKGMPGDVRTAARSPLVSAQNSPTKTFPRSTNLLGNPKVLDLFSYRSLYGAEITSEELNSIVENIMTWVVATVTSILYPAITKYEERLKRKVFTVSDESMLSSDSSSFCSTCSEEFTYGNYTSATNKAFQPQSCRVAADTSVRPTSPLKHPSAHVERKVAEKTCERKEQSNATSELNHNKATLTYSDPKLRSCKSDSHLLISLETDSKMSKDATTETDTLVSPSLSDKKAKAMDELKNLKNVFINFKCHLKGETKLILESVFQEIMSDLTEAIPSISSVTAEVFVDQNEPEKEDAMSSIDISSVASDIVENMFEKLESAVEKKYAEIYSQEDLSIDNNPSLTTSGEYITSSSGKTSENPLPGAQEPMSDIAENMVHVILEKLMTLASYKQNEPIEDQTECSHQQHKTNFTYVAHQRNIKNKSSPEQDICNLISREKLQNLISNVISQSSLVHHIEEAISTILGYIQAELSNERIIASEETVVFLQLLDDIFTQLHQGPVKTGVPKSRQSRQRNLSETEEKYRLASTRLSNCPSSKRQFPPVNVPGMVLYSEDDNEEVDNIVKNVLDSSFQDEKARSPEHISHHWFTEGKSCFEYKRIKLPSKPISQNKFADDWSLKTELPPLNNEHILKKTHCLHKGIPVFSQYQKYQIQKASENIVKCNLTEMLKDVAPVSPDHLGNRINKKSSLASEKSQGLSHQEWMDQMFSVSEISAVAQEITDAILNILHKASCSTPKATESSTPSSVPHTSLSNCDTPLIDQEVANKKALKTWLDSEKKMKHVSSLNSTKPSWSQSEEREPKSVDDINDKIIDTIFNRLKLLVCPKLQAEFKLSLDKQSSLKSQLSTYTTKVVNVVLRAIQKEFNKKNLNVREADTTKCFTSEEFFGDTNQTLEPRITNLNDDIMAGPLFTWIYERLLNKNEDQRNTSLSSDKSESATSYGYDDTNKPNFLPSRRDKESFCQFLATPCMLHGEIERKDSKKNTKLPVVDKIGEILHELLSKLISTHPDSQAFGREQNRDSSNRDQQKAAELKTNTQLISQAILEYIIAKLCSVDVDTSFASPGLKAASEPLDVDNPSFASLIEEMANCVNIISSIISRVMQKDNKEVTKSQTENFSSSSSKKDSSKETHQNKLKCVASDILNMVFAKLEGFANGNLATRGVLNDDDKKSNKMDWECAGNSTSTDAREEPLQSALYMNAKKVSSAILKAIQTELNVNSSDFMTSVKNSSRETQMFLNIVNLILDTVSSDRPNETESEDQGIETYRYRPIYGNFLPGGAESDSFLEDDTQIEKNIITERASQREETITYPPKQWILERTLNEIEVKLKEPHKSPIIPIIRKILNEIFQNSLINQLNVLSLSNSPYNGMPHSDQEFIAQSTQLTAKTSPLVSDTDVALVANDVIRTIFHKLCTAAMREGNVNENRCHTITFSANLSFHEHIQGENAVSTLDRSPYTVQSRFSVDQQTKVNIIEDIVQAVLINLERFVTSKVKPLFCFQDNPMVPETLCIKQDKSIISKTLTASGTYSSEQFSDCSVHRIKSGKTNSLSHMSLFKLNIHAKEVATKILQGIKHKLDKESPLLTHNIVVCESITSEIVNTVLDIISHKTACENNCEENDFSQQDLLIEKLFSKTEYRKTLQFQMQDTIESILCDIYEKTLNKNNFSFAPPTLKYSIANKHSEPNSEISFEGANRIISDFSIPKSDVILLSEDIVDIVLQSISSAVELGINTKHGSSASVTFSDTSPKAEFQQSHCVWSKSEGNTERFPYSSNKKSAYANSNHIAKEEQEDTKNSVPDPCEENANFITKTIFNRLQTFATERMDSLISLAAQPKEKSFVIPGLENYEKNDRFFHESSQGESDTKVLKIPSAEAIVSKQLADSTFTRYREKLDSTIHVSQASLKEYADIIASAILRLIKKDLDLEIQKMHLHPNITSFLKSTNTSEIIDSILNILHNKRSVREMHFSSEENPDFSQLTESKEILLGCKEKGDDTTLSLFTDNSLENNQMTLEKESQKITLEKILMRNGKTKEEKKELLRTVAELLNELSQRVMEVIGHLPPFNKVPCFSSKAKTSDTTQNFQLHINHVANDIVETVLEKMYSVVVTSLYKNNDTREVDKPDNSDTLLIKPPCLQAVNPPKCGIPSNADSHHLSVLGNTSVQFSPLEVGNDLVQMILQKMTNFVSLYLEESLSPEECSDELQLFRQQNSKVNPKPGLKPSLKPKSLPKFRTKPHIGPSGARAKSKVKLGTREKTLRHSQSKTGIHLPHVLSTNARNLLEAKLPTAELKSYANNIIRNILKTTMKEFERMTQSRAIINTEALPPDQITEASKIVDAVLQELCAINNHNLTYPIKFSHLDDLRLSQRHTGVASPAKEQPCFYLDNVSSQLEQIFPTESIFKKMFDKWQTESNDMEKEKITLMTIADSALTQISIKAKDLEYFLSLLNLPPLEDYESRFQNHFKGGSIRKEDTKAHINMFGREIVEMLFEKLQLCFLSQMPTSNSKATLINRECSTAKKKHGFSSNHILSNMSTWNSKTKDQISIGSCNQVIREIVERVLNILESFVDLQFKHISKYEFSEIVKMPIENLEVQQRVVSKKVLPKLQPLKNFSDESKSSTAISKESVQNALLHVHSFHSELLTYAVNIVSDMLGIIKNKLDKEISQMGTSSASTLQENSIASEIIGILMDQCTHFSESLIKNLPVQSSFQETINTYVVNQVEFATDMKMPTSNLEEAHLEHNLSQSRAPGLSFYSLEDRKGTYKLSSDLRTCVRASVEDTMKSSEPMERTDSGTMSRWSRTKFQYHSQRNPNVSCFDEAVKGNSCLPEGSILQKLLKKANDSTQTTLKEVMSFIEMGKGENPRVFHYENQKPVVEPNQIRTTVSPLRICLAAENIVNTVLSSYGFPNQLQTNESMETMKPFFISKQNPLSEISAEQKNREDNLLRMWAKKNSRTPEKESSPEACRGDFSLLQKWQNSNRKIKKTQILKEVEVISFADHELGPNEIHLVARHVTTSVITYLKNFKPREKVSCVSTLLSKNYKSSHPLRSIYSDSPVYQLCEHLTESVICHLLSSLSEGTRLGGERDIAWEIQGATSNKIISINSRGFESRSVSVGQLGLSISEVITEILSNANIIEADIAQCIFPLKTKYIYHPGLASAVLDDFFQDLLTGVIRVLSEEIGINHHLENRGRKKSFSMPRSTNVSICSKTHTTEKQPASRDREPSPHQMNQLIQKNKANYLTSQLDSLVSSLKTQESKEVVNKVFNIVADLFLPDEFQDGAMDCGNIARSFSFPNKQDSNSVCGNNLGLSPKSVFLLNVVCEKLIRTLLEKYTSIVSPEDGPLSNEISVEDCQLLHILQMVEDGDFDYCKKLVDSAQPQRDCTSYLLESLAEMDQDLLSPDFILTSISHSLVKSLMNKLCYSLQEAPECSPFEKKFSNFRTKEIQSHLIKAERPEFVGLEQGKVSLGFMSHDSNSLTESLRIPSVAGSRMQAPLDKRCSLQCSSLSPLNRQETKEIDTVAFQCKLHPKGINTRVYSATFLEEIISELFFNLSTSLWEKNANITEAQLSEINSSLVNNVVSEFNNAQVMVLRNAEERLCFPPIQKDMIRKIVDSVYYDVLWQYELKGTYDSHLANDSASIAEQIMNGILLETLDYQLSPSFKEKTRLCTYYPLDAEIILQKLKNNLRRNTFQPRPSKGYSTMLSHSFLEDAIRKLLSQLISPSIKPSSLGKNYLMSSDFNEISTCITNKVISAISKHKIWFTGYDNQYLCTERNLQKMVDSIYGNILQMSDSLLSIQRSIISRRPIMVDQIASFIIQEVIENHLQPFLYGELLPRPQTPLDAVSSMVKQVLGEVIESHRPQTPSPLGIYPNTFVKELVVKLLSKIFSPKPNTEVEIDSMTQKIVESVNNHFDQSQIHKSCDKYFPSIDRDTVDELVTSVYSNILRQYGLDPTIDKQSENSDIFVENITSLIVAAISNYLLHPLLSGDLSTSYPISMAENILQDMLGNANKSVRPNQMPPAYDTLLPYTFLEDMIRLLLTRFFPSASSILPNRETSKDKSRVNFNEIASNLISDIRMKISQHEIRFSKDEDVTKFAYSEDEVQHLVDSVFKNILQSSGSQESVERKILSSNDVLIDRIAGFIIKHICEQHLLPFVEGKSSSSPYRPSHSERQQLFYASVYSSTFLEDVVSGVLRKIFHRVVGIVQVKSARDSEDELFDTAEELIHLITEEFSIAQVRVIDNAEEQLCLPPLESDVVRKIIDVVYNKVLGEYEMEFQDFLNDTRTLAAQVTETILVEIIDFQIPPNLIANLPLKSYSKLSEKVLINRVQCDIRKSRFRRQASAMYTTMLSNIHLEKIVTQLLSQISPAVSTAEHSGTSQSDLSETVIKLINEIMSIISKHSVCITKHGNGKQNMLSEKDIQSIVDSIYADLSHCSLYQSLTKDRKDISNVPVSKIASFIIREIFNHHLQSFVSEDKTFPSASVDQTLKQKTAEPGQKDWSFIVNSAIFFKEVISELLCKLLFAYTHNVFAAENSERAKAKITHTVTLLVKSIVLEFTTSEILIADNLDKNLIFSEECKELVQKTVSIVYEKILDEYKSLIQVYEAIQSDPTCFGRKIYYLLLEEIYDYQLQSLVSGELVSSSCSSLEADDIIRNVLSVILKDSNPLSSCVTVFPCSLLENIISKLLAHLSPSTGTENELNEGEHMLDKDFVAATSNLIDEIIKEISEHEIRLAIEEENAESVQVEAIEKMVDSICSNILEKSEFQAEVQKEADRKGGSFLSKIAGFIMREIMNHHLRPFLYGEESSSTNFRGDAHTSVVAESSTEMTRLSLFSATFLEDIVVDLVHKFFSFPTITKDYKKREAQEPGTGSLAIKFANSLIGEFSKNKIKVLPNAEEIFSFPPVDKETVNEIGNFVYDQFIGNFGSTDIQKDNKSNAVVEMIAALATKAISAFKIQPLFSGNWSSTLFSFLNPDNITQRVKQLPQKTSAQITRRLKDSQHTLPEPPHKQTFPGSDQKDKMDSLEKDRGATNRMNSVNTKNISVRRGDILDPILTILAATDKSNIINLLSGSSAGVADEEDGNTPEISTDENRKEVAEVASSVVTDPEYNNKAQKSDVKRNDEEEIGNTIETPVEEDAQTYRLLSLKPKENKMETVTQETPKIAQKPSDENTKDSPAEIDTDEEKYSDEFVENVSENIYEDILEHFYFPEPRDFSKPRYSKTSPGNMARNTIAKVVKDSAQSVTPKDSSPSTDQKEPAKDKVEFESKATNTNHPHCLPKSKPGIFPAKFLEDVITEMVNKLVFSSSPEMETFDRYRNVKDKQNQAELYDTAVKLINSLMKEFSDAQIKVFRPDKGKTFSPQASKEPSISTVPHRYVEETTDEASSSLQIENVDKVLPTHKTTEQVSSDKTPFLDEMLSTNKLLVGKIVHSSICNILKEYSSQESIRKNINSNEGNLAGRLTRAVINELFQHQLNLIHSDKVSDSACLPLESKNVVEKIQTVVQRASKECQTSSPYTIMLPYRFLEDVISALLSKIFSKTSNTDTKAETPGSMLATELDILQMRLVSTVAAEISKDDDMIIRYVETLHPDDNEIIEVVVQSIYTNLLPRFGSQEAIQNCVTSGCSLLSETIVGLVLREVAGNQLQNYFCGELTPYQCAEVDNVVENILKNITQTTSPHFSHAHRLSYVIIEEITVKFLSKLLSLFPNFHKRPKFIQTEMQKIILKILNSVQEFISKSNIKVVPPDSEPAIVPLADSATIENVVNSVYASVVKYSGSHDSVFKDLMGKSNVLSDIIGFLLVKEISSSKFQPQEAGEEVTSSELVWEAVKIMEKVVKIVDEVKSQEHSSTKKGSMLNVKVLEEALALVLSKLVTLPCTSSKDSHNISKVDLSHVASQLIKSVTAEISRSSISLVPGDTEKYSLSSKETEIVTRVVDSIYSDILQQHIAHEEDDSTGSANIEFPKVASLIIDGVSRLSLDRGNSKNSSSGSYESLDINRIIEKTQEHAVKTMHEKKTSNEDKLVQDFPVDIVPHVGKKAIKVDPQIISEHLAVLSVKTEPLERLKMECLRRTGHSIAELRKASISGRKYSNSDSSDVEKTRRTSLNNMGRLDVKPFEVTCRNSFQNVKKPDISKVELLKDVQDKKDLIIRLVAHDINQNDSESNTEEEDETIVGEVVGLKTSELSESLMKEVVKPIENKVVSSKTTTSTSNLKKMSALGKCCQPTSSANIECMEKYSNQVIESNKTQVNEAAAERGTTTSKTLVETESPKKKKLRCKKELKDPVTEPMHHFIHRIMSVSSYNQEDFISSDSPISFPGILTSGKSSSVAVPLDSLWIVSSFEGHRDAAGSASPTKEVISETPKPSISKQGSKMLAKVSSTLSKVFSRSSANVPKSRSPPHPNEK